LSEQGVLLLPFLLKKIKKNPVTEHNDECHRNVQV